MRDIQCTRADPADKIVDFELKHLKKLEICQSKSLSFCTNFVPSTLKILKFDTIFNNKNWIAELLGKQKHLKELSLLQGTIGDFKYDPENCHIEKLELPFDFSNDRVFQKFSEFIKIQQSITELSLLLSPEELEDQNRDYPGILTHLLSLKSMKKLTIDCFYVEPILKVLSRLKVCNPTVDTLIINNPPDDGADLNWLPKFFPNVVDLAITWPEDDFYDLTVDPLFVDLKPINSMEKIRKFEMQHMSEEMLAQLEVKGMREFHLGDNVSFGDDQEEIEMKSREFWSESLENWKRFLNNNCQLDVLDTFKCYMSAEKLLVTLENLPLLKSLEYTVNVCDCSLSSEKITSSEHFEEYATDLAEKIARLIGEKYDRLEHLKFHSAYKFQGAIENYLEKHYPGAKLNK